MSQDDRPGTVASSPEKNEAELPAVASSFLRALSRAHGADTNPNVQLRGDSTEARGDSAESVTSARIEKLRAHGAAHEQRYVLEREIGRGGMGAVLKIFDADLRRHLAMKVVLGQGDDPGADTSHIDPNQLLRFLEEAQVTGQLDHPGVVPVHELGVDAAGRVYFTMRLVKGQELSKVFEKVHAGDPDWNRTRALGVLLKVCEAMSYAHDKGVVHRDLKPANIMVGRHGEVYVMDWGLARVEGNEDSPEVRLRTSARVSISELRTDRREAAQKALDSPILTGDGSVMGTPYYMPPEQAAGRLAEIGPHSDVYALGAMLYHLLTGRMPYHTPGDQASPHTILALVMNGTPRPIHELVPGVSSELESICEKAMAREARERYADMGELAEDLRAYVENRVVQAHRTGAVVELVKWVQRNKALAATVAALVCLTVGGSTTAAAVLRGKNTEIRMARDDAINAKELADAAALREANLRTEAEEAQAASESVTDFLVSQFEALEPGASRGRAVQVVELLDLAVKSLEGETSMGSVEAARLRAVVGKAYQSLGIFPKAEPLLERAWQDRSEFLGEDHPDTLTSQDDLAVLYEHQGRYAEAEPLQTQALEKRRAVLGMAHPSTLDSLNNLAYLYESLERNEEAERLYAEVYEQRRAVLGEDHPDTLTSLDNLALLYELLERYEEAEPLMLQAHAKFREVLGEDHPSTITSLSNLALLYGSQGRYEESERLYAAVLEQSARVLGEEHPDTLDSLNNLAWLYEDQSRYEEAERLYAEVIEKSRRVLGKNHPDTLITLNHLVELHESLGQYDEAEPLARELVDLTAPDANHYPERKRLLHRILEALREDGVSPIVSEKPVDPEPRAGAPSSLGDLLEDHAIPVASSGRDGRGKHRTVPDGDPAARTGGS